MSSRLLPSTRAFLNEADLVSFIEAQWEVDVVSTRFAAPWLVPTKQTGLISLMQIVRMVSDEASAVIQV